MATHDRLSASLAGRYDVKSEIGAGGMATVFLAHDVKHDRDVAIKVLHPDLGAALGSERFLSEIKTTAKLQHPHILPLLDSGEADSLLYYVMPYVVGESLRARLERQGQLAVGEAVRISREVAGALDYAHRHGVVHRDIKPENILLHDGQALVADFGIALAVSAAGGARMTQTGLSLGTPQYMSPEQAMGERSVDARSDIYALGAVTYEMLTGEPPFTGASVQAIVSKIMTQKPTPILALRDTVPETVDAAVMTALCKLPADRFASASEFATALTTSSGSFTRSGEIPRAGPGRRRMDMIAKRVGIPAIPVAALALAAAAWAWTRPQTEESVRRYTIPVDPSMLSTMAMRSGARMDISPDGSTIVYMGGAANHLIVRRRDEFREMAIPGTDGAIAPALSRDGRHVAFGTFAYDLKVVPVTGGATITVAQNLLERAGFAWGYDGYIYSPVRADGGIQRVRPIADGKPEPVTYLDSTSGEVDHVAPFPLPGGKGMLFGVLVRGPDGGLQSRMAALKFGSRRHSIIGDGLAPKFAPSGHIVFRTANGAMLAAPFSESELKMTGEPVVVSETPQGEAFVASDLRFSNSGTLIFTAAMGGGQRELVWVSRDGSRTPVDTTWLGSLTFLALSPDGSRVAVAMNDQTGAHIWIKTLDRGPVAKLTLEGRNSNYPTWTPDGKSVSYYSDRKDRLLTLWKRRADASDTPTEIATFRNPVDSDWSPDGRWLVFRTSVSAIGKGDIYAVQPGTGQQPIAIASSPATEQQPAVSRDGRWLAYTSAESGTFEVYVVPFPNTRGLKWAISSGGGSEPAWSRDGRELFYRDANGNMVAVTIAPGDTFTAGASRILFSAKEYAFAPARRAYDVAPDGRFLMIWARATAEDDRIYVVDNWFEELKRKVK